MCLLLFGSFLRMFSCCVCSMMIDGGGDCIERGVEWTSINIICATNNKHINFINTSYYNNIYAWNNTKEIEVTKSFFPRLIDRCSGLWKALSYKPVGQFGLTLIGFDNMHVIWLMCADDGGCIICTVCIIICHDDVYYLHQLPLFHEYCHLTTFASSPSLLITPLYISTPLQIFFNNNNNYYYYYSK